MTTLQAQEELDQVEACCDLIREAVERRNAEKIVSAALHAESYLLGRRNALRDRVLYGRGAG